MLDQRAVVGEVYQVVAGVLESEGVEVFFKNLRSLNRSELRTQRRALNDVVAVDDLDRVGDRGAESCGACFESSLGDAVDLLNGDKRTRAVVNGVVFCVLVSRGNAVAHTLGAAGSARDKALHLGEAVFVGNLLNALHVLLAADNYYLADQMAFLKCAQSIFNRGLAEQRQKLLAVGDSHSDGTARCDDDRGNKVFHSVPLCLMDSLYGKTAVRRHAQSEL